MFLSTIVLAGALALVNAQSPELTIATTNGDVTGIINGTTPSVRQFLSIPYALPPVDDLRFLPPQPLASNSSASIDATRYPPSCPQFVTRKPSVYNQYAVAWLPNRDDQSPTAGESLDTSSEDCLYLAIWTPANATNTSSLPVLFFMTGGAFVTGGVDIPIQVPSHWVERTQSHVVVTINYRVNIFGFPNSPALSDQNVGILDQRAALEWVESNIAAFGGDPERITLWGQSAGAVSVDIHNFAYPSDPIASSMFAQSGTAFLGLSIGSTDLSQTNFTFLANSLGCNSTNDTEILSCMQGLDATTITNALGSYTDNQTQTDPVLVFAPIPDEKVVFSNYTDRYVQGAYANIPMIYSFTTQEGVPFVPYPSDTSDGINVTAANDLTAQAFLCPAAASSLLRSQINATTPTYRYSFAGNFSNISPIHWFGAYHAADLAMLFGTHQDLTDPITGQGSTQEEFAVSEAMQDYVLNFAANSRGGQVQGWATYQEGNIVEFGNGGQAAQDTSVADVDGVCTAVLSGA